MLRRLNVRVLCAIVLALAVFSSSPSAQAADETLLARFPTVSENHVAFVYAGDIWVAPRDGGDARRLTVNPGVESGPRFSPDGKHIAFTGNYDGNTDVYVVPVEGGSPKRLTWHPGPDQVRGWTPDGRRVVFRSLRESFTFRSGRHYTVSPNADFPSSLILPVAEHGTYSPDGKHYAYTPIADAIGTWKRYRGGQTTPVWIFDFETHEVEEIPHENATDTYPMWIGKTVYFLSDRNHTMNLFAYDTEAKTVTQVTRHADYDVKSASAGAGVIVYEQRGRLHVYDPAEGKSKSLRVRCPADLPHTRPHWVSGSRYIRNFDVSPSGARAVFEVRGDIVTVPAKKGDIRHLTSTSNAHDRSPAWSPDGKWIATFSDESGEYKLVLRPQNGKGESKEIALGDPSFYYGAQWSPDSNKVLYTTKRLELGYVDIEEGEPKVVDVDLYDHPQRTLDPQWSPDSKWITYTKRLESQLHAVFVHDVEAGESHAITDGLSDARYPTFSRDGKYLFFAASTNLALATGWLDMTAMASQVRWNLYVALLDKDEKNPFARESDEEKVADDGDAKGGGDAKPAWKAAGEAAAAGDKKKSGNPMDLEGIRNRILSLPGIGSGVYANLQCADGGKLFFLDMPTGGGPFGGFGGGKIRVFDMRSRKASDFMSGATGFTVSANGKKLMYSAPGNSFGIVPAAGRATPGQGRLALSGLQIHVDPRAEWKQIYDEAWRVHRDFFYDPGMHGANWGAVKERYRPFLDHVGHRTDLNHLLSEMAGELVVGHAYVTGGDSPSPPRVPGGVLGADIELDKESGRYRITKILSGHNWNPGLRAPLTEPGVDVKVGDYVLAVDGIPLEAPTNFFSLFERKANRSVELRVNDKPVEDGSRIETVVPLTNEFALRNRNWIERNRAIVDEMSGGRLAYVYLPDTGMGGFTSFNRDYFAGIGREGAILDERYNGGGSAADYIIDFLERPILNYWATREGEMFTTPTAAIFGPKVMIVNEYSSSGGDAMPYYFRKRGVGPLVGTRTWGGLVGIYDYPTLIDGGMVRAPRVAIVSTDGEFVVENAGVAPDIEVLMTPKDVIAGRDPQLERAIEECMSRLEAAPVPSVDVKPFPLRARPE